jgi:hypothetical protein
MVPHLLYSHQLNSITTSRHCKTIESHGQKSQEAIPVYVASPSHHACLTIKPRTLPRTRYTVHRAQGIGPWKCGCRHLLHPPSPFKPIRPNKIYYSKIEVSVALTGVPRDSTSATRDRLRRPFGFTALPTCLIRY